MKNMLIGNWKTTLWGVVAAVFGGAFATQVQDPAGQKALVGAAILALIKGALTQDAK